MRALAPRIEAAPISQRIDALEIRADLLQARDGDTEETLQMLTQAVSLCEQDADAMQRMAALLVRKARTSIAIGATADAEEAALRAIPLLEALPQPGELALALVLRSYFWRFCQKISPIGQGLPFIYDVNSLHPCLFALQPGLSCRCDYRILCQDGGPLHILGMNLRESVQWRSRKPRSNGQFVTAFE